MTEITIIKRVHKTQLPVERIIVIGSGILDVLGLRQANDLDLVADEALFAELAGREGWELAVVHGEQALYNEALDVEVWKSWGSDGVPNFAQLREQGIEIEGVTFTSPEFVLEWKKQRGRPKDKADIRLLEEYLAHGGGA